MPEHWIKRVKQLVFFDEHSKRDGTVDKFDPDKEMAAAWKRLFQGDFIVNDIKLLEHEYIESKIEQLYKIKARKAYDVVQQAKGAPWNYPIYLGES